MVKPARPCLALVVLVGTGMVGAGFGASFGGCDSTSPVNGPGGGGRTGGAGGTGSGGTGSGGATGGTGTTSTGGAGSGGRGTAGSTGTGGKAASGGAGGNPGGCVLDGVTVAPGATVPSSDGCNSCSCTQGGQIACTDRACAPDGGSPTCTLDAVYKYGFTGGLVLYEDQTTLTPPGGYLRERRASARSGGTDASCAPTLPPCNTDGKLDVANILHDLTHADVQRALQEAQPPLYGRDQRPVDGSIFSFQRADGRGFLAGSPCSGSSGSGSCLEVPAGIAKLVEDLQALDQQQLADASCAALR